MRRFVRFQTFSLLQILVNDSLVTCSGLLIILIRVFAVNLCIPGDTRCLLTKRGGGRLGRLTPQDVMKMNLIALLNLLNPTGKPLQWWVKTE